MDLNQNDVDNLRLTADKFGLAGRVDDRNRLLALLDAHDQVNSTEHEDEIEALETERDEALEDVKAFREALTEIRDAATKRVTQGGTAVDLLEALRDVAEAAKEALP